MGSCEEVEMSKGKKADVDQDVAIETDACLRLSNSLLIHQHFTFSITHICHT